MQGALLGTSKVFNHKKTLYPMCYTQFLWKIINFFVLPDKSQITTLLGDFETGEGDWRRCWHGEKLTEEDGHEDMLKYTIICKWNIVIFPEINKLKYCNKLSMSRTHTVLQFKEGQERSACQFNMKEWIVNLATYD